MGSPLCAALESSKQRRRSLGEGCAVVASCLFKHRKPTGYTLDRQRQLMCQGESAESLILRLFAESAVVPSPGSFEGGSS
ncbi:hypothetical protein MRB53_037800 [Persea americana]|nr:hypothetical protein MRB53_037800 [Persea americana]